MKLLLTSQGLTNDAIRSCFLEQVVAIKKPKVCVLYTVKNPGDEVWLQNYVNESNKIQVPYEYVNISEDLDLSTALTNYDVYYVAGGNTFYILDRLRKTKMDKVILDAIYNGKLYVGLSAGSIIAGPDIEIAGVGPSGDENDILLQELNGLNLVNFFIFPHYSGEKDVLDLYVKSSVKPLIALTDQQAILINDDSRSLIGDHDGGLQYNLDLERF